MYKILVLVWKMVHAFHLGYNCCVSSINNPIQYEPAGHLVASFKTNAATRGETFQNGDLFLWNLVISAPLPTVGKTRLIPNSPPNEDRFVCDSVQGLLAETLTGEIHRQLDAMSEEVSLSKEMKRLNHFV